MKYHFLLLSLLLLVGCRTSKKLVDRGEFPVRTEAEIIQALEDNNKDWTWYALKSKMDVTLPDEHFKGTTYIRMKKDSVIWTMVKKFAIEAVRVLVEPDDVTILNRIETSYMKDSPQRYFRQVGLNYGFRDVQEFLFGNIILPSSEDFTVGRKDPYYIVSFMDGDVRLEYYIDAYTLQLSKSKNYIDRGSYMEITYDDYKQGDYGTFPYKRHVTLVVDGKQAADIEIDVKELLVDVPKNMPFSIPSHYDRVY